MGMVKRCCGRAQQRKGEFMIRITQLKLSVGHTPEQLKKKIAKTLKCAEDTFSYEIVRQSLDARHKDDKKFVYTVDVKTAAEQKILRRVHNNNIMSTIKRIISFLCREQRNWSMCRLLLEVDRQDFSAPGIWQEPVIVHWFWNAVRRRRNRKETVDCFWKDGVLDPDSNVQFGEGGAGTFSDGKLNTLVKDPNGRNHEVLKRFVEAGAPEEIVYQQKPHLGTDVLIGIVETMRHQIEEMGGSFRFETKVTDLCIENGHLTAVEVNNEEKIPGRCLCACNVVLCR